VHAPSSGIDPYPPIVVLAGPTAVGKSQLALQIAEQFGGEIVTADSRQVYRYMDIGTVKPTRSEMARVRHHMIDLIQPDEQYSAQRFREEGLRVLRGIAARGRIAVVAGGTGFYLRALLDGMVLPAVPPNEIFREELREVARVHGSQALHARLAQADPVSARRIHPHNAPRLVRALEIVEALGGPIPVGKPTDELRALRLGLTRDRSDLHAIADARVLHQIENGMVDETRDLLAMGYVSNSVALSGLGYREMVSYLEGRSSLDGAIADYQAATRRYIRRQYTWFNADKRIRWFDVRSGVSGAIEAAQAYVAAASSAHRVEET
jgi:tRNA dimethylallyltransferase